MSGLPNPIGAPSFSSSSRLQSNAANILKQLYRLTGDYNYNAFKDCHHEKTPFVQHVYEISQGETNPTIKFNQPFAGIAAPY